MKTGGGGEEKLGIDFEEVEEKKLDGFVEIAVFQVNYTLKRIGDVEKPIIHVFGRTIENKAERVQVHGFRPYLYTLESSFNRDVAEGIPGVTGWERENEKGQSYVGIKGEKLVKIYGQTPRDVGKFREEFDHYEADILFPNRFLIDKGIESGIRIPEKRTPDGTLEVSYEDVVAVNVSSSLRINTFDIEVEDRNGFPENGEETILCISSHDSYTNEYTAWIHGCDEKKVDVRDHKLIDDDSSIETYVFETEEEMLEAFMDYIDESDPDVLTGWNFVDFDISYFVARLKKLSKS